MTLYNGSTGVGGGDSWLHGCVVQLWIEMGVVACKKIVGFAYAFDNNSELRSWERRHLWRQASRMLAFPGNCVTSKAIAKK